MTRRKPARGRPSGTDGSDYSFRMAVDSRYNRVIKGKSRLCALIFTQGFIQFLAALALYLSTEEGDALDRLDVSSTVISFISLLIGELGRKRSHVILLKLYMCGSSIATLMSVSRLFNEKSIEIIKEFRGWETSKYDLIKIVAILIGLMVQIIITDVTTSLVGHMAPHTTAT